MRVHYPMEGLWHFAFPVRNPSYPLTSANQSIAGPITEDFFTKEYIVTVARTRIKLGYFFTGNEYIERGGSVIVLS